MTSRRLIVLFVLVAIALGGAQAWTSRFSMNNDGLQYLEDGDLYFQGDGEHAANVYWSPLYPWLLGAMLHTFHPSAYWEFPAVHAVNFIIFLCALAAYLFFILTFLKRTPDLPVPRWTVMLIGFAAFLYTTMDFTKLALVSPDLLLTVFVYLAAALLLKLADGRGSARILLILGIVLGFGYLTKVVFNMYAAAAIGIVVLLSIRKPKMLLPAAIVLAGFALAAAPYVVFLSKTEGRFTLGDSGKFNMIWLMNRIPYFHARGSPTGHGTAIHPTRQLSTDPAVYEFATPIAGSYPLWFNPVYWNEGIEPSYNLRDAVRSVVTSVRVYAYVLHHRQLAFVMGAVTLFLLVPEKRRFFETLRRFWPLLGFAIFPFFLYLPLNVEPRLLGAFYVLFWILLFSALLATAEGGKAPVAIVVVMSSIMFVEAGYSMNPPDPIYSPQEMAGKPASKHLHWDIAYELKKLGSRPGDRVALAGREFPYYFARLARVRVVSEVFFHESDWGRHGEEDRKLQWQRAKALIASTGARFVLSPVLPGVVDQDGWVELGDTGYYAYRF